MTAKAEWRRSSVGGMLWIFAILLLGLMWLASLGAGMEAEYAVSPHAAQKHGATVNTAADYLRAGGSFQRDPCRDGKEMWVFRFDGKLWLAIVRDQTIVTLFETTERYLASVRQRDGCGNGLHLGSHDAPSMAY